jgi:hypothetical protein
VTAYKPGDDVLVDFDGVEGCRGEVLRYSSGYVMAVIDLTGHESTDWKGVSGGRLDPQPTVCVPERHVRPAPPAAAVPRGVSGLQ